MYKEIKEHAIIGNLKSAALVTRDGTIDWAPAPFISSPSIFASILDDKLGGYWSIRPHGSFQSTQKYLPKTNIVVTNFEGENGLSELTDFMPVEKEKEVMIKGDRAVYEIYRRVKCITGTCKVKVEFAPKLNYALGKTKLTSTDKGLLVEGDRKSSVLVSELLYKVDEKGNATAEKILKEGEELFFLFRHNTNSIPDNNKLKYELELKHSKFYWERWVSHCNLEACKVSDKWEEQILRSALVLKILFFEPTGAVAAAPTTSLPEEIGGVRNWDYRFSWIRDSSFVLSALLDLGHYKEARKYIEWLMAICSDEDNNPEHPGKLQIMYGINGEKKIDELFLTHLSGYKNSKPVRIGNNAYLQKQWDVYGSILNTVWKTSGVEGCDDIVKDNWKILRSFADYAARIWQNPDEGLWEVRGGKKHFTYSKVMCWVALDRALKMAEAYQLDADATLWRDEKQMIYEAVMERGWNSDVNSFVQCFDSSVPDTSLLRLPRVGFIEGSDEKMLGTIEFIENKLSIGDGLLNRYKTDDGLPGKEGAFLLASFWLVDALVLAGEEEKAATIFEKVLSHVNHVGLFSEEISISTGEFLGNFPQAYTHIGLINSAFKLSTSGKSE